MTIQNHPLTPRMAQICGTCESARARARKRQLPFDKHLDVLCRELFLVQGGRCALSGISFDLRDVGFGQARRPLAPSVDRIYERAGYIRGNVRLVLQAVNFARNSFGDDVLRQMARGIVDFDPTAVVPLQPGRLGLFDRPPAQAREQP